LMMFFKVNPWSITAARTGPKLDRGFGSPARKQDAPGATPVSKRWWQMDGLVAFKALIVRRSGPQNGILRAGPRCTGSLCSDHGSALLHSEERADQRSGLVFSG